jgi:quercetin dioxygenase-like cupin family protein
LNRLHRVDLLVLIAAVVAITSTTFAAQADDTPPKPRLETLLHAVLEGVDSTEVILSHIDIPPAAAFPRHYHPGEEFVYVLEGSGTAQLEGDEEMQFKAGDVVKIPFERVHWAKAGAEGFKAIVFRVHKTGMPERIMAE